MDGTNKLLAVDVGGVHLHWVLVSLLSFQANCAKYNDALAVSFMSCSRRLDSIYLSHGRTQQDTDKAASHRLISQKVLMQHAGRTYQLDCEPSAQAP